MMDDNSSTPSAPAGIGTVLAIVPAVLVGWGCYAVLRDPRFGGFEYSLPVAGAAALAVALVLRSMFADTIADWRERPPGVRAVLDSAGPVLGLLVVVGLFALNREIRPYFFTGANAKIILTQTVVVAIGALGMTMVIVSGGIDLSCGSVVALASVAASVALMHGWTPVDAAAMAVVAGGVAGLVNGAVIAGFGLTPFIVTLGMMGVARGVAKWLADNQTVNPPDNATNHLMDSLDPVHFLPLPPGVWIALALAVLTTVAMRQTVFGRRVFAIGSNEDTARLCGIRVRWCKVAIYTLAGMLTGLAGLMQLSRLTQGDPTAAIGLELDIIAAVVIGGASLSGGTGSIPGAMIGALIMSVLRNGSNQMEWPNYMQEIIIGAVIVLAVGIDRLRHRGDRS